MLSLSDFLAAEVAAWLAAQARRGCSIAITGPPRSGRTALLGALTRSLEDGIPVAGLSEDGEGLPCLAGVSRSFTLLLPELWVRGMLDGGRLTGLVIDQMGRIAVVDEPSPEAAALLPDLHLAGVHVWTASRRMIELPFEPELGIWLSGDVRRRVEQISLGGQLIY